VLGPIAARARPAFSASIVTRLSTRTPEGTDEVVVALEERSDTTGQPWVRVQLPILPHGSTGWVPRTALGSYALIRTRLVLDTKALRVTLIRDGKTLLRAPIGIGKARWPTPKGTFYVRNKLTKFKSPFYGPVAFGTSARSDVLTDWPGGGFVGIHGTNRPEILPGRVSHGCVRMRNPDIVRLAALLPVGTPVVVV